MLRTGGHREQAFKGRDGHWYLVRARPYMASHSRVSGVVLAFVDMALAQSHGNWLATALINLSPAPVAVVEVTGAVAQANEKLAELTGYDSDDLIGLQLPELLTGMARAEWDDTRRTLTAGGTWHGDGELGCRDGRTMAVSMTLTPLLGPGDAVAQALAHIVPADAGTPASAERNR